MLVLTFKGLFDEKLLFVILHVHSLINTEERLPLKKCPIFGHICIRLVQVVHQLLVRFVLSLGLSTGGRPICSSALLLLCIDNYHIS